MVLFNYATKEMTAKIVYYGPGLCGKTTNLQFIHENLPQTVKGKMLSLATKTDRTLFFDFLPLDLGEIRGMKTRVQLYTVPGQVFYNETRKLVLKGVDGVVFVADSQQDMLGPNVESFGNLEENLNGHGLSLAELPHVIQFNKRDLPKLADIDEINSAVNRFNAPFYESVATTGIGVKDTLNAITKLVLVHLTRKYGAAEEAEEAAEATQSATPVASISTATSAVAAAAIPSAVTVSEVPTATAVAPAAPAVTTGGGSPGFNEDEIDDLMNEVQAADDVVETLERAVEETMPKAAASEPVVSDAPAEISLTESASDDDLFNDPNLEVARMSTGETTEIIIPVEVGSEEQGFRRFKLSLKLNLDAVD
jgi:signal recognition particle receptor subunit beta